jgi:hypothetical protein
LLLAIVVQLALLVQAIAVAELVVVEQVAEQEL